VDDGDRLSAGTVIAEAHGAARTLLGIERTLLNFLQRLCGVATLTRRFVDAVSGTQAEIYDTRKTIPGWRVLDKYAVRCGGGRNHRHGLHDAVLVKDNHLSHFSASGLDAGAFEILNRLSEEGARPEFIEFEVDTPTQLEALFKVVGINVILLDNFTLDRMREAVARRDALGLKGKVALEASGKVTLETVRQVAETGVERIAVGALTHSATALDIGMDIRTGA
jgi:nicotinate-nucleotide pyrophosphorylase (carboxylating)